MPASPERWRRPPRRASRQLDNIGDGQVLDPEATRAWIDQVRAADPGGAPKTFGWATLFCPTLAEEDGVTVSLMGSEAPADSRVVEPTPNGFGGMRLDADSELRVALFDADIEPPSGPIAHVDVTARELRQLAQVPAPGGLVVHGRTDGAILLVVMSVSPAQSPTPYTRGEMVAR